MEMKTVKELMVARDQYAVVSLETTLHDAIIAIEEAQKRRDPRRQPFRAVLVSDEGGRIVGKLGQLAFLKALQPQREIYRDSRRLASAGVSEQYLASIMDNYRFLQDNLSDLCLRACGMKVKDVMHPISESIDENTPLGEAIFKIIQWECLSVPVTRGKEVVGLLRLSDLCQEIADYMKDLAG